MDALIKYECVECQNQFIVSAVAAKNSDERVLGEYKTLSCPFCGNDALDTVGPVTSEENEELLSLMGCLGIYVKSFIGT